MTEQKTPMGLLGTIDAVLNNKRVPKWALGVAVIVFTVAFMLSDLNIGTLLQNKLENDKQIQLQLQTSDAANEAAVITAISDLNKDLNSRLASLLDSYNQQSQLNINLVNSNATLVQEVAALRYDVEQKQAQLNVLRAENDRLQMQIDSLTTANQKLTDDVKLLTDRVEHILGNIP